MNWFICGQAPEALQSNKNIHAEFAAWLISQSSVIQKYEQTMNYER